MKSQISNEKLNRACLLILTCVGYFFSNACQSGILLDERFEDNRLLNWTVIDEPNTIEGIDGHSQWLVETDGWLHQRSNLWGPPGDFINRWYGTLIVAGDASWSDYVFMVKSKADDDDGFGVLFRFTDAQHFYRLLFIEDRWNGGPLTRLDRREGANYTELWSAPSGYKPGVEMTIRIEVKGDLIRGFVDGQMFFEVHDNAYPKGKIGLFCYAQGGQAFDNVKVVSQ
ncbi:MAG TPA: hypothetical protein VNN73_08750 [Blastocatellia bacterium]|nr:hypothetical protein [Blastocatellia bacterium]